MFLHGYIIFSSSLRLLVITSDLFPRCFTFLLLGLLPFILQISLKCLVIFGSYLGVDSLKANWMLGIGLGLVNFGVHCWVIGLCHFIRNPLVISSPLPFPKLLRFTGSVRPLSYLRGKKPGCHCFGIPVKVLCSLYACWVQRHHFFLPTTGNLQFSARNVGFFLSVERNFGFNCLSNRLWTNPLSPFTSILKGTELSVAGPFGGSVARYLHCW